MSITSLKIYPNNVRAVRKAHPEGLTVREVARRINKIDRDAGGGGRSAEALSKLERERAPLSDQWIRQLMAVLRCTEEQLRKKVKPVFGFADEVMPYAPEPGSYLARTTLDEHELMYRLRGAHLDDLGVMDGDVFVVTTEASALRTIKSGDLVLCQMYCGGSLTTLARQFVEPHLLITNSRKSNQLPINISVEECTIKGLVRATYRERSSPPAP